MTATNKLLTVAQAAKRIGLSPMRVRQLCQEGKFGTKLGDRWIVTEEELKSFERNRRASIKKI